jgi:hypothetical protein
VLGWHGFLQVNRRNPAAPCYMSFDYITNRHPDPKEWVIVRKYEDYAHLVIRHEAGTPAAAWVAKLRVLHKPLESRRPAELLEEVRKTGSIDLGIMAGRHAIALAGLLEQQGYDVLNEDASYTSYFPTVAGNGLIIEDEAENDAFCLDLIQRGATVQQVEA